MYPRSRCRPTYRTMSTRRCVDCSHGSAAVVRTSRSAPLLRVQSERLTRNQDDLTAAFELTNRLGDTGADDPIRFVAARSSGTPSLSSSPSSSRSATPCPACAAAGALEIFLDRDDLAYGAIMRYLRSGRLPPPGRAVHEEATWLGLDALAEACAPTTVVGEHRPRPGWI